VTHFMLTLLKMLFVHVNMLNMNGLNPMHLGRSHGWLRPPGVQSDASWVPSWMTVHIRAWHVWRNSYQRVSPGQLAFLRFEHLVDSFFAGGTGLRGGGHFLTSRESLCHVKFCHGDQLPLENANASTWHGCKLLPMRFQA